jgi:hypothetical protein
MRKETPLLQNTSKAKKKSIITMTEIHTFRCDRYSREAFINHAWETQERSLLESRQRTLLPWAFVLFLRGPPSPVQDGRRDGWDRRDKSPDDRRLVFDVISTRWLTISALWDYCLCQIGQQSLRLRLPSLQSRLLSLHTDCLCNLGRLSPPSGTAY